MAGTCGADQPAQRPLDVASIVDLTVPWSFAVDPSDDGRARGFASEAFDDRGWRLLDAGRSWEEQGVAFDGVVRYRPRAGFSWRLRA